MTEDLQKYEQARIVLKSNYESIKYWQDEFAKALQEEGDLKLCEEITELKLFVHMEEVLNTVITIFPQRHLQLMKISDKAMEYYNAQVQSQAQADNKVKGFVEEMDQFTDMLSMTLTDIDAFLIKNGYKTQRTQRERQEDWKIWAETKSKTVYQRVKEQMDRENEGE